VLWFDLPIGSIKRISTKSFVDDLILGRRDVSFRAVSYCELLNLISNLTWRFECFVIHSSLILKQNWSGSLLDDHIAKTTGCTSQLMKCHTFTVGARFDMCILKEGYMTVSCHALLGETEYHPSV
jgi:hypothetical protein